MLFCVPEDMVLFCHQCTSVFYFWNVFLWSRLACTFVIFQKKKYRYKQTQFELFCQNLFVVVLIADYYYYVLLLLFLFQSTSPLVCRKEKKERVMECITICTSVLKSPCLFWTFPAHPYQEQCFSFPYTKFTFLSFLIRLYLLATGISDNIFQLITKIMT